MESYKKTLWITIIITLVSFFTTLLLEWKVDKQFINLMFGHRAFVIDFLMGIFTGGIMAIISLVILYFSLKEKTKVKTYYQIKQFRHKIKTFELYLKLTYFNEIEKEKEAIINVYQYSYEMAEIFYDLSLDEVTKLYGNKIFNIMQNIISLIQKFSCDICVKFGRAEELKNTCLQELIQHIQELETFIDKEKFIQSNII